MLAVLRLHQVQGAAALAADEAFDAHAPILARGDRVGHPRGMRWRVYLLRCGDGTFYAGITNDLARRLAAHRCGKGARYTRGRGPLQLVHEEPAKDRAAASRREHELKQLSRADKLRFLDTLRDAS